jgi:hypothetical protein
MMGGSHDQLINLAARDAVNPTRAWLGIWHARVAYLAAVSKHPNKHRHDRTPYAAQCRALLLHIGAERQRLRNAVEQAGREIADHNLVIETMRDVDGLADTLASASQLLESTEQPLASQHEDN